MQRYRSGVVAERTQWVIKRGIRRSSGQNLTSGASNKFWAPLTGHNGADSFGIKFNSLLYSIEFNVYAEISKWS